MRKTATFLSMLFLSATVFAQITQRSAVTLACIAAQRLRFNFETNCQDEFFKPVLITQNAYIFKGLDASGDCGIQVAIHKITGQAQSKVSCNL